MMTRDERGSTATRSRAPLTQRVFARAQRLGRRFGVHVLTESLESPVARMPPPDADVWTRRSELPGVEFDVPAQMTFVESSLTPYLSEFDSVVRFPANGRAFPLWNGFYQAGDAEFLYAILRHFKPRQILELGSGFSTFVSAAAAVENAREGHPVELTAVDPSPRADLSAGIEGLTRLERRDGRDLPLERLERLGPNDVLFVDTSHAVKLGGELNWLVLEVLPRLGENVLVHFHDVYLPHEYPRGLFDLWPYFNEQYLLQAFLVGNADYEIVLGAAALVHDYPDRVRTVVPSLSEEARHLPWSPYLPSAFWLRRRARG
jgi:methyltransferase family protein